MFFAEFDDYAEIVDDDPDYAHPMAGIYALGGWGRDVWKTFVNRLSCAVCIVVNFDVLHCSIID